MCTIFSFTFIIFQIIDHEQLPDKHCHITLWNAAEQEKIGNLGFSSLLLWYFNMSGQQKCHVCGKAGAGFRIWATYANHKGFYGITFQEPASDHLCNGCYHRGIRRAHKVGLCSWPQFQLQCPSMVVYHTAAWVASTDLVTHLFFFFFLTQRRRPPHIVKRGALLNRASMKQLAATAVERQLHQSSSTGRIAVMHQWYVKVWPTSQIHPRSVASAWGKLAGRYDTC